MTKRNQEEKKWKRTSVIHGAPFRERRCIQRQRKRKRSQKVAKKKKKQDETKDDGPKKMESQHAPFALRKDEKKTNKPVNQDREIKMLWNSRFFFGDFSGFLFFFASTATGEWFTVCNEYVATASRLSRLLLRPFSCFFLFCFSFFF